MGEIIFLSLIIIISSSAIWVVVSPNLVHSAVSLLITLFGNYHSEDLKLWQKVLK